VQQYDGLGWSLGYEDFEQGQRSLRKLAALDFEVACFGHGKAIPNNPARKFKEKWGWMVCLRCRELGTAYHRVLETYVDLMEFRKGVDGRGQTLGLLLEAGIADIENRLREQWSRLSEHRSRHHYFPNQFSY
jgi:hypothetical protein